MSTEPAKPAKKATTPIPATPLVSVPAGKPKTVETLKVAYTKAADSAGIDQLVIFGTDNDRSDFLREHTDEWWRIADVVKGEILHAVPNA